MTNCSPLCARALVHMKIIGIGQKRGVKAIVSWAQKYMRSEIFQCKEVSVKPKSDPSADCADTALDSTWKEPGRSDRNKFHLAFLKSRDDLDWPCELFLHMEVLF